MERIKPIVSHIITWIFPQEKLTNYRQEKMAKNINKLKIIYWILFCILFKFLDKYVSIGNESQFLISFKAIARPRLFVTLFNLSRSATIYLGVITQVFEILYLAERNISASLAGPHSPAIIQFFFYLGPSFFISYFLFSKIFIIILMDRLEICPKKEMLARSWTRFTMSWIFHELTIMRALDFSF